MPSTRSTPLSTTSQALPIASGKTTTAIRTKRVFSATARQERDHHFDTLKFVQRLKDEGFTEEQAVAMMKMLSDVVEERFVEHKSM